MHITQRTATVVTSAGLVAAVLLLRFPFLTVPMITDEGGYLYWASSWSAEHQLYRDFDFARPQGILVVYKLLATVGGSVESIRFAAALYTCVSAVALLMFARLFFSKRSGVLAGILFAVFSAAPRIEGFTANAELFTLAPLVLNAYCAWTRQWLLAGVASSIAFQLKPSGIEGPVLVALWILLTSRSLKETLGAAGLAASGFALASIPALLHAVWVGWEHVWRNLVTLRGQTYTPDVVSLASQWGRFERAALSTGSSWLALALLFAAGLSRVSPNKRRFCLAWLGSAIIGMAVGLWWDWHFFVQIIAPLCFASGHGFLALPTMKRARLWGVAFALSLALFVGRDGYLWFATPKKVSWEIYHRDGYLVADQVAEYVKQTTTTDETIYVAFGQAEIYHLSRRRPAVPTQMYYAHAEYFDRSWSAALGAVERRDPVLIIWVQPPPSNRMTADRFKELVLEGYDFDRQFGSVRLFRRRKA